MKRIICIALGIIIAAQTFAANQPRRRPPRPKNSKPSGGIVEKEYGGKVFRIQNAQTEYQWDRLAKLTRDIRYTTLLPIECVQRAVTNSPFEAVESLVNEKGVGAGALVVDDDKLPVEIISPDRRWGILNIAQLKADNPSPEKFEQRFVKVYWGIIARTLGAGTSSFPGCVLVPFTDMKGLDAIAATRPCPEPFNKMIETGEVYGIGIITIASYRRACEVGWAPAPTNDVQKAIWEEVHRLPTEPIKIKPETKKVKE